MHFLCNTTKSAHLAGLKFLLQSKKKPNHPELLKEDFAVFEFSEFQNDELLSITPSFWKEYNHYALILFYEGITADILELLKKNIFTKRAVFSFWKKKHNKPIIDVPCLIYISFQYTENKLNMISHFRANDAVKIFPINLSILRCFHKLICLNLGVPCGKYIHQIDSFHIYRKDTTEAMSKIRDIFKLGDFEVIISSFDLIQEMQSRISQNYEAISTGKNNTPLYKKIKQGKKPNIQILDNETVNWIGINAKPEFVSINEIYSNYTPINWKEIKVFIPKLGDFHNKSIYYSIHGVSHAIRVIIYAGILSKVHFNKQIPELLIAAGYHDIMRIRDSKDIHHTINIVNWLKKSKIPFERRLIKKAEVLLQLSENGNKNFFASILRSADALDRYRLPSERWWPKKELLSKDAVNLIELAKYLTWKSEKLSFSIDPIDAVKQVALELGVVSDE